jgi:hypothetical protein
LADGFQRKRLKCEKLRQTTNDRHQVMPKAHICLWQNELKRILKCEYLHVMYSINMQGFCYNFTSTGQLSNIRQFLSDNLSLEIVLYWTVVLTICLGLTNHFVLWIPGLYEWVCIQINFFEIYNFFVWPGKKTFLKRFEHWSRLSECRIWGLIFQIFLGG